MPLGTHYLLDALAKESLDHLFLVPGGLIDPFLPALADFPHLKPVVAAQEGGAAYMADGYARASGNFGAALCIGGPGLGNMTTALATALTDESRILALSGEVATAMEGTRRVPGCERAIPRRRAPRRSDYAFLDLGRRRPQSQPSVPPSACGHARAARGPVHLSLPLDVVTGEVGAEHAPIDRELYRSGVLDRARAEQAVALMTGQGLTAPPTQIALLAGAGVEHAEAAAALVAVAERFHLPVATTLRAKGVFPEDHPLSLGVFGYAGTRHATAALLSPDLDLLVVLGSGLNERDTMHWTARLAPRHGLIGINLSSRALIETLHGGLGVPGDVGAFLAMLADAGGARLAAGTDARRGWLAAIRAVPRFYDAENLASEAVPLHPARVIHAARAALARDGIVLVDSGAHRAFAGHYWQAYAPRTYISATNLGPMGWAIPAAVGVACAKPGVPVAVITGDGCMQMHGLEVAVAARYRLPIAYIVLNNGALGNVWLRAHALGPIPAELTTIPDHDWAGFGRALGVAGLTVRQPAELEPAFAQAFAGDGPYLVDVKVERNAPTPVEDYAAEVVHWSYHA